MKIGELRKVVESADISWRLAERLVDAQDVPRYPLGAAVERMTPAAKLPALDLGRALMDFAPALPQLQERFVRLGLMPKPEAAGPTGPTPVAGSTARASAVDWRSRWGWNWVTSVRDQNPCGACVDFGNTALVEAMTRIEHCVWTTRSEGDLHDGNGRRCADGWWPTPALEWVKANGIADPGCYPWDTVDNAYRPTPDRPGRTVRIDSFQELGSVEQQKVWLDSVGPLSACYEVFDDFFAYGSGVYRRTSTARSVGWHCVLIVGYDDAAQCWIAKNSWGAGWGDRGYFRIGYGDSNIDLYGKWGVRGTNPDPLTRRRLHNGNVFESGNGAAHRNFEMLATAGGGAVRHWFREGSGALVWKQVDTFPSDAAACPTFTSTTYGRNMEGVYPTTGRRLRHCHTGPAAAGGWRVSDVFGPTDTAGIPAFLQSDYGAPGNFEVVVRTGDGKLAHWWRVNGSPWTWSESARFGSGIKHSGPSMVQTRSRDLELVAVRDDGRMQVFRRNDADGSLRWSAAEVFGAGVDSPPVMIEGQFGSPDERSAGNYELCVQVGGRVEHWWRDNQGMSGWRRSAVFGQDVAAVAGMLQGSFGFNLEVVVLRRDGQLQHYWRDGRGWNQGVIIGRA